MFTHFRFPTLPVHSFSHAFPFSLCLSASFSVAVLFSVRTTFRTHGIFFAFYGLSEILSAIASTNQFPLSFSFFLLSHRACGILTLSHYHNTSREHNNNINMLHPSYNPSYNTYCLPPPWLYHRLTLSQFAVSASEQEPLYPDDEDVEEILMRLRHGHDYYRPQGRFHSLSLIFLLHIIFTIRASSKYFFLATPAPSFPLLFPPHNQMRPQYYEHPRFPPQPMPLPPQHPHNSHNKGSLFHILSQEPENLHHIHGHPPHLPHNNHHMRKLFFEDGLMESSDELDLEFPKAKKIRRDGQGKVKSPLKSIVVNSNDDVQEKENVAAGLCFKTHKPKVQREYYYAKLSKTIFRWTCCGSQAKTHPDA